ncbi:Chloride channel protein [Rhodovastum atsumiense]|uniref:Chloride channel protein n=1 Tax=Rhodovastum atsumiense TaxID=504468 RepID=A0A5M6IL63_9PROT|nr:chloride channel protein [Rhodovastum atsumiense]KAA5609013.1 chloride channel protein [Rhodovastum atsumiense]CAH2599069.1 Chloride channel protein [Rhodovastum atsumiense]
MFQGTGLLERFRGTGAASARPRRRLGQFVGTVLARQRHRLGEWVLHVPHTLRALVRADEIWLVVLAAGVGLGAGVCVTAMTWTTQAMHRVLFALGPHERLSGQVEVEAWRALIVPTVGGLLMGVIGLALARWWPRRAIDPIEANALYGGRMSLNDSLILVGQTMVSNGCGASVGLEAGYTQIGSALGSRLGRSFRVRRSDLRLLVGCGAAGAIGAAFNAPLTGAFYAFELVIGTYSLATLAPVVVASISAVSVVRVLIPEDYGFDIRVPTAIEPAAYLPILALGMVCALGGIAIMRGVTLTEEIFRRSAVPGWARPAFGGLVVGMLALVTPQVLSSGHAALQVGLDAPYSVQQIALLILLKSIASAVSIGSGFRGGLFFASLFLGGLLGKLFAACLAMVTATQAVPSIVCALVGMSGLAVAVVGGPLTMAFLVLESTGSLPMTIAVVAVSVVSSLTVRRTFGYSFATWRFHLRGEAIRSAVDIGWMRSLTVGRMMRREVRTVRSDTPLAAFRRDFPLGATARVVVVDEANRYAGIVALAEAHATDSKAETVAELIHNETDILLPQMTIKEAVSMFEQAEADALAVVDGKETKRVIGLLTEQHALRRYSEELDRRRRELSGE